MDRKERIPVIEPLLLILKSRKGMAMVVSIIVLILGAVYHIDKEILLMASGLVFTYIGGQTFLDSKEYAKNTQAELEGLLGKLGISLDDIVKTDPNKTVPIPDAIAEAATVQIEKKEL